MREIKKKIKEKKRKEKFLMTFDSPCKRRLGRTAYQLTHAHSQARMRLLLAISNYHGPLPCTELILDSLPCGFDFLYHLRRTVKKCFVRLLRFDYRYFSPVTQIVTNFDPNEPFDE